MASSAPPAPPGDDDQRLLEALKQAEPRGPRGLSRPDPGAVLALAAHCCMLENGFQVHLPGAAKAPTPTAPPVGWDRQFPDEWVFEYVHPSKAGRFMLHCSLQRASGRMLVSCTEAGAPRNRHMLGLQLANYIPGGEESLNRADWAGVISRQGPMLDMVTQFVAQPVLAMAGDLPETAPSAPLLLPEEGKLGRSWLPPPGSPQRLYLLAALTAGVAVAAGVAVVVVRRRRGGR